MTSYLSIGQHQLRYPQVWQRANSLAISRFVVTVLGRDFIGICSDVFGDRKNLEYPEHSPNQSLRRDALTSVCRFISAINPETYPSGRYRQTALPT